MTPPAMPRILLVGDPAPGDVKSALEAAGFPVAAVSYAGLDPAELRRSQLVLLDVTPRTTVTAQSLCRRWRIEWGDHYVPVIWLCFDTLPALLTGALDAGADACLPRDAAPTHLLAQVKALLRVENMYARSFSRANEANQINQRLQQAYQQIDSDLEMARRIHRAFLPKTLPTVHQTRFAVCHRGRSRVGGDFYDVIRLDEEHVAVYLADAMGKGLPASSLLGIFVKKSLKTKEITGRSYRIVPPNEVLAGLNRDIVNLDMPEPPFVTMLYMQVNCKDGAISFARASHPLPIHVPAEGSLACWESPGGLLGVFDAEFPTQVRHLKPGDRVLLVSDGARSLELGGAAEEEILAIAAKHRGSELNAFTDAVSLELLEKSRSSQDFTLLALEYR